MFGGKVSKPQNRIDSLIGEGTVVDGDITFAGGLRIDGRVRGNVCAADNQPSTLVLSEKARVDGEIHVSHVVVNGAIFGPLFASEYVELQAKANVSGDIHYRTLEIQLGAVIQGRLVHQGQTHEAQVIPLAAVESASN